MNTSDPDYKHRQAQSPDEIYQNRFAHSPLSEPTRKANRNLLLCLIAVALAWYSDATLKGSTIWGLSFGTTGAPLEPAIAVLSWLFLFNWLEPIAIDIQRLRIAAASRRKEHITSITYCKREVLEWEASIKTAVNVANKRDESSTEAQLNISAETKLSNAKAALKHANQAQRGFWLSYVYRLMVTHIAPLSAVPICTIVALANLNTPAAAIPTAETSITDGDTIRVGEEAIASTAAIKPIDGDTFRYNGTKVRLSAIDTPEPSKYGNAECAYEAELGDKASAFTKNIITPRKIEIEWSERNDKYGRALAKARVGNEYLGDMLIDARLAMPWKGRQFDWCG